MKKLNVGILGATGMVGQRFIQGLQDHPYFNIACLSASERSEGKSYKEAAKWYLSGEIPDDVAGMSVQPMDPKIIDEFGLDLVFSSIPSEIAKEVEGKFAEQIPLFSNTKTYRMEEDVPLVIAEVNPRQLDLIKVQKENRGWNGYIVTNANCSTIGLALPLKPIFDEFGLEWVHVATLQALSGAGYAGVPSMAIVDNVIPYIGGEEPKVESETLKILGSMDQGKVKYADFEVIASCNRVQSMDGHMKNVFIGVEQDCDAVDIAEVLMEFRGVPQELKLPTAPDPVFIVREELDRPQPRLDRDAGKGMAITVGPVRKKSEKKFKFTCLSHNTIRGAAGASILNAELALSEKLL
ncbi:MAG: aspartate-semialdehyde dehydrogenase [Candidatus Altiarchaeota archaeon]